MGIQRKNEMPNMFYLNMTAAGSLFQTQVVLGRNNWSVSYWGQMSLLANYKETEFGCRKSVFPRIILFFGYRRKLGVTSLSFSSAGFNSPHK